MIKTIFNILLKYRSKFFIVFFIEIIYIFLFRYKGNRFKVTNNKNFTDNIPTPYLFLLKIDKFFKEKKIKKIVDVGCGSGRVIYFFSRKNPELNIDGYEIDKKIYSEANYTINCENLTKNMIAAAEAIMINGDMSLIVQYLCRSPSEKIPANRWFSENHSSSLNSDQDG